MDQIERYFENVYEESGHDWSGSFIIRTSSSQSGRLFLDWLVKRQDYADTERLIIDPDEPSIKLKAVKPLYRRTALKQAQKRQVVMIIAADRLTHAAQNALLKLLEEPPAGVRFMLSVTQEDLLLPTVRSRLASYSLPTLSLDDFSRVIGADNEQNAHKLYHISGGNPVTAIMQETDPDMAWAKDLLIRPLGELTAQISKSKPARTEVISWTNQLYQLCRAGMQTAQQPADIQRWIERLKKIEKAKQHLKANVNPRLVFISLLPKLRR